MAAHIVISAVDLVYKIVQMSKLKWFKAGTEFVGKGLETEQKDFQILNKVIKACASVCDIKGVESFDSINLLEINVIRAMMQDPQDAIV